ncbi:hypothetical protein ICN48_04575 [Polynucleobacter sp. JS-Safj-400b-B2]|uniref:hypothetical protein n=1 Tax=Polynucleobacter sp. JS-Safj-400b-B2 TaxID=2576921 RepID=UPI001C0AA34D|nr:hypothetical protein [Polynucleobacter sp. JS-Safj-400b-B2]MBU3625509.1 hypothetical protein [Polynucleobacter sp. JS-Safj-400b-B2]
MNIPSNNNNLLHVLAFPKGKTKWRISWFGEVAFPNRMIRRRQPSVLVHLTAVKNTLSAQDAAGSFQKSAWVSVGILPSLHIGDIWQDGYLLKRAKDDLEQFADIEINAKTAKCIKAGFSLEDGSFLLPVAEYPWHMVSTHSHCICVELPAGKRLIIPCIEIARFYFGSSSKFFTQLFLPPLTRNSLYSNPVYEPKLGRLTIDLANGVSGRSAADIGRFCRDPVAWKSAVRIGASMLDKSRSGQTCHIQTAFPFEGKTTLQVSGQWLSLGDVAKQTFIVHSIHSCSHPFPFKQMRYNMQTVAYEPVSPDQAGSQGIPTRRIGAKAAKGVDLVEKDAGPLAGKSQLFDTAPRFPDLRRKYVYRGNSPKRQQVHYVSASQVIQSITQGAVGDAGSAQRIRPIDLGLNEDPNHLAKQEPPEFLLEAIRELGKSPDKYDISVLTHDKTCAWTVPVPIISNEYGEIHSQLFVQGADGKQRVRRAAVFLITWSIFHRHFIVVEDEPAYAVSLEAKRRFKDSYQPNLNIALEGYIGGASDFGWVNKVIDSLLIAYGKLRQWL